jgi:hypothetical protein
MCNIFTDAYRYSNYFPNLLLYASLETCYRLSGISEDSKFQPIDSAELAGEIFFEECSIMIIMFNHRDRHPFQ